MPQTVNICAGPTSEAPCALYMVGISGHSLDGIHPLGVFSLTSSRNAGGLDTK